jgi:hypothetical protein
LSVDEYSKVLNRIIRNQKSLSDEALDGGNEEAKSAIEKFKSLNTLYTTNET